MAMASLRDIKRKIVAVQKDQQITRAMNMVAASKLRRRPEEDGEFPSLRLKFMDCAQQPGAARVTPEIHPLLA